MSKTNDEAFETLLAWRAEYRKGMVRGAMAVGRERGYSLRDMLDLTETMPPNDAAREHGFNRINAVEEKLWNATTALFEAMTALNEIVHSLPPRDRSDVDETNPGAA